MANVTKMLPTEDAASTNQFVNIPAHPTVQQAVNQSIRLPVHLVARQASDQTVQDIIAEAVQSGVKKIQPSA